MTFLDELNDVVGKVSRAAQNLLDGLGQQQQAAPAEPDLSQQVAELEQVAEQLDAAAAVVVPPQPVAPQGEPDDPADPAEPDSGPQDAPDTPPQT